MGERRGDGLEGVRPRWELRSDAEDRVDELALRYMGKPGSEIQAPMALVILGGLRSSTALNMLVVPAAYFRFGQR